MGPHWRRRTTGYGANIMSAPHLALWKLKTNNNLTQHNNSAHKTTNFMHKYHLK